MGAGAQVGELALGVEGDGGVGGKVVDELHLIGLLLLLHKLHSLRPGQLKPLQLQLLLADLAHLALDLLHDLRREGEGRVHIIVESLVDGGADGQLHLGIEALDGLGQHVGAGMPVGMAVFGIFKAEFVLDFFGHGLIPPCNLRGEKNPTPDGIRGEIRSRIPRFHPACAQKGRRSCPR